MTTYKVDLHTHSIISPDGAGSITRDDFDHFLESNVLDCLALTDHNETSLAIELHKKWGDKIIVGEEITTRDGEMIGLFLTKTIKPGMSAKETANEIHRQGGLVCIPHPFETLRKGMQRPVLETILPEIDIFEVFNGRGRIRGNTKEAQAFAKMHKLVGAASSDAHGYGGIGKTYSILKSMPTRKNLITLLKEGSLHEEYAPLWSYLYPIINRIKNTI